MAKYLDDNGLLYLWGKLKAVFYRKPNTGIPKTDLSEAVQTSLGKADSAIQSHQDISGKADLESPTFTGTPAAPTAAAGTNTTQIATTAFVKTAVDNATAGIASAYKYKGSVATYASLPASGNEAGDVWNVETAYQTYPAGTNWAWTGSTWDPLGGSVDLSPYMLKADMVAITNAEIDTIVAS